MPQNTPAASTDHEPEVALDPSLKGGAHSLKQLPRAPGPTEHPCQWEVCGGESSHSDCTRHENEKSKETALRKDREKHCNTVPVGQGLATAPLQTHPSCSVQKFRAKEQIISSFIALS